MTRILHLSDPHFGAVDREIAEVFLATAAGLMPDLTILSGDLTMRARHNELAAAGDFVNRLPAPRLVIPGNHDIPIGTFALERFFSPFQRFQEIFGGNLEPELIHHGVHVVSLNSSRAYGFHADWSEGRLSKRQLAAMVGKFAGGPAGHLRVLVLHHPLLGLQVPGRAVVKPLGKLMEAIENARVDLVLCGHFHRSQLRATGITSDWKTVISQAPTVCSTRLQGEPQGFHEFQIEDDRINAIHHFFRDGAFVPAGVFSFARTHTGWHEAPATEASLRS